MQACENQLGYKPATSRRCSSFNCTSDLDCSYHGSCSSTTGQCGCNPGFLGQSCSVQISNCLPGSPAASPARAPATSSASVTQVSAGTGLPVQNKQPMAVCISTASPAHASSSLRHLLQTKTKVSQARTQCFCCSVYRVCLAQTSLH